MKTNAMTAPTLTPNTDSVVSLFCGAGGLSYGFTQAGLKPAFSAEIDTDACETYRYNIDSECFQTDLGAIDPNSICEKLNGKSPFAVIGGPPCQGFSTAGSRNSQDPRNKLIFNYLAIVRRLSPRWFVFENVEGLLTSGSGESVAALVRKFLEIGYSVRLEKVNFAAYGVPQTRKRVLIIGNKLGIDFEFPSESHSYESGKSKKKSPLPLAPSLNDALQGLGKATTSQNEPVQYSRKTPYNDFDFLMREANTGNTVCDHWHKTKEEDQLRYSHLLEGQTMKDLPEELWHPSFKRRANRRVCDGTPTEKRGGAPSGIKRLHGGLNSLTITGAATREFIHPNEDRALTLRECARIQTFPDCYRFSGKTLSIAQQIGNAVPPLAAQRIAEHLLTIDSAFGADISKFKTMSTPCFLGYKLTEAIAMSPALKATDSLLQKLLTK